MYKDRVCSAHFHASTLNRVGLKVNMNTNLAHAHADPSRMTRSTIITFSLHTDTAPNSLFHSLSLSTDKSQTLSNCQEGKTRDHSASHAWSPTYFCTNKVHTAGTVTAIHCIHI